MSNIIASTSQPENITVCGVDIKAHTPSFMLCVEASGFLLVCTTYLKGRTGNMGHLLSS